MPLITYGRLLVGFVGFLVFLLVRLYWFIKDKNRSVHEIDKEIGLIEKNLKASHGHVEALYDAANLFDGLGQTAGGYPAARKNMLEIFWMKRDRLRARRRHLLKLRSKKSGLDNSRADRIGS